jgi:geranylgeranyl diphosphate synthase, type II
MSERLCSFIVEQRSVVEAALANYLPRSTQPHARQLNEALQYALFPGGKRWRPLLTLLGAQIIGAPGSGALAAACAMEYLHTSSLIFDDLPAMDDAAVRRGRAALHHVYGEGAALLAGLALLNESYALLSRAAADDEAAAWLIAEAARCIGTDGMIGGQAVDLVLQGAGQGPAALVSRNLKTTALMRLTLSAGAMAGGASADDSAVLAEFGEALGMAYQIGDDLLDELAGSGQSGKPAQQDARHGRSSYVAELGVEGARRLATSLIEEAKESLRERFGARPEVELLNDAAATILHGAEELTLSHV